MGLNPLSSNTSGNSSPLSPQTEVDKPQNSLPQIIAGSVPQATSDTVKATVTELLEQRGRWPTLQKVVTFVSQKLEVFRSKLPSMGRGISKTVQYRRALINQGADLLLKIQVLKDREEKLNGVLKSSLEPHVQEEMRTFLKETTTERAALTTELHTLKTELFHNTKVGDLYRELSYEIKLKESPKSQLNAQKIALLEPFLSNYFTSLSSALDLLIKNELQGKYTLLSLDPEKGVCILETNEPTDEQLVDHYKLMSEAKTSLSQHIIRQKPTGLKDEVLKPIIHELRPRYCIAAGLIDWRVQPEQLLQHNKNDREYCKMLSQYLEEAKTIRVESSAFEANPVAEKTGIEAVQPRKRSFTTVICDRLAAIVRKVQFVFSIYLSATSEKVIKTEVLKELEQKTESLRGRIKECQKELNRIPIHWMAFVTAEQIKRKKELEKEISKLNQSHDVLSKKQVPLLIEVFESFSILKNKLKTLSQEIEALKTSRQEALTKAQGLTSKIVRAWAEAEQPMSRSAKKEIEALQVQRAEQHQIADEKTEALEKATLLEATVRLSLENRVLSLIAASGTLLDAKTQGKSLLLTLDDENKVVAKSIEAPTDKDIEIHKKLIDDLQTIIDSEAVSDPEEKARYQIIKDLIVSDKSPKQQLQESQWKIKSIHGQLMSWKKTQADHETQRAKFSKNPNTPLATLMIPKYDRTIAAAKDKITELEEELKYHRTIVTEITARQQKLKGP